MKRLSTIVVLGSLTILALALAGCGKKADQAAGGSATSDSLLASSPVEQPQGQIKPDSAAPQVAPAPVPSSQGSAPAEEPRHHTSKPVKAKGTSTGLFSGGSSSNTHVAEAPSAVVAAGTNLSVTFSTPLTSETAAMGAAWSGTLKQPLDIGSTAVFPAGATVNGVVAGVKPAQKGSRAYLVLQLTSITGTDGASHDVSATADSLIAGSTTKRNVGAIVGGAAAGALLGKAMGGSGKGALIGGLLGGAAVTGAVASSKGFQVEVPAGKEIVFHVDHDTKVRL